MLNAPSCLPRHEYASQAPILPGVIGRVQTRSYDDAQGQKRYVTEVIAEEAYFADSKREDGNGMGMNFEDTFGTSAMPDNPSMDFTSSADDDLPF